MIKLTFLILTVFLGIFTISCSSLVYSPSINMPDKIQKDETKILAAYEKLPLTTKNEEGKRVDDGFIVAIQHSYSNRYCMQLKYWSDIHTYGSGKEYKHGASLSSYILLNDTNATERYYLAPTIGMSLIENVIKMETIGSWFALQIPTDTFYEPYFAIGLLYGKMDDKGRYGLSIMSNLGANVKLYKQLKLGLELSLPIFLDIQGKNATLFWVPSLGFNYTI